MPAWVLPLAGCKVSLVALPVVTVSVAVPLVRPVAEAVIVAFPTEAAVKPDFATPLVATTGDAGLHDPDTSNFRSDAISDGIGKLATDPTRNTPSTRAAESNSLGQWL